MQQVNWDRVVSAVATDEGLAVEEAEGADGALGRVSRRAVLRPVVRVVEPAFPVVRPIVHSLRFVVSTKGVSGVPAITSPFMGHVGGVTPLSAAQLLSQWLNASLITFFAASTHDFSHVQVWEDGAPVNIVACVQHSPVIGWHPCAVLPFP